MLTARLWAVKRGRLPGFPLCRDHDQSTLAIDLEARFPCPVRRAYRRNWNVTMSTPKHVALLAVTPLLLTSACGPFGTPETSEPAPEVEQPAELRRLQTLVEDLREETALPGLVVALAGSGQEPMAAGAGFADTDQMIPAGPDTPFFIGSISKNLFSVVALQLVEEGLLGMDEPLSDHLEWPRGDEITVRMLMNHTTGIPDYFDSLSLSDSSDGVPQFFAGAHAPAEIFRMMPSREPTFDPGTEQAYSNTNGLLLGRMIEEATGKPLGEVFDERIVAPLGLENTYLYGVATADRRRARGYCGTPGWVEEEGELIDCSFADEALPDSADGSVVASAKDLLRYHQALRGGELLSESSWEAMRHVEPGQVNGLNYLIMTGPRGDHEGNAGRALGHVSANVYYVEPELFVVMLLNRGDAPLPMRQFLELWLPEVDETRAPSIE
jgi:D-alanyl-D-alanine carboxypeptidase